MGDQSLALAQICKEMRTGRKKGGQRQNQRLMGIQKRRGSTWRWAGAVREMVRVTTPHCLVTA